MRSRRILRWLTAIYVIILFVGAVIPLGPRAQPLYNNYTFDIRGDYLLHALIYLPMPMLLAISLKQKGPFRTRVVVFSLMFTILFESIQLVVPYRAFNINDMLANGIGVLIGLIPAILVWRRFSDSGRLARGTKE